MRFDVDQINECQLENDAKLGVIAHELAHLFLGHVDSLDDDPAETEQEAKEQAIQWGYKKELDAYCKASRSAEEQSQQSNI